MRFALLLMGILILATLALADTVMAQAIPQSAQTVVKLDLSPDLITLLKFAVWAAAIFLALLAAIGIAFFGFDVRKARGSVIDATSEIKILLTEASKLHAEVQDAHGKLIELKTKFEATIAEGEQRIEELGAQLDELMTKTLETQSPPKASDAAGCVLSRGTPDLIREVLRSSSFEWTTIGRLIKRTGLDRESLLQVARQMPDVDISIGKKTADHIFRLKQIG